MSSTSIGRGPASGGNENHDGDPRHTTLGESVQQEPPAGSEVPDDTLATVPDERVPPVPDKGRPATR